MAPRPQKRDNFAHPTQAGGGGYGVPVAGDDGLLFDIRQWGGINTKADRTSIEDNQFSWLENLMPIGDGNLRTLPSNGPNLYSAVGKTIVWFFPFNIAATPYMALFFSDGTAVQVNLTTLATTTISAVANRFYNGGDLPAATQLGSSGIIIVTTAVTDGYFAWDGTTLYVPGDVAPGWLSGLVAPLTFTGNTHTTTTVDTLVPNTTLVVDGMGITGTDIPTGATVVSHLATSVVISAAATGTHAGNFSIAYIMPTGVKGTAVEMYQSRVWIDNGTTKLFSAPSNGARFDSALGGGALKATDSFLKRIFVASKQQSSFLYSFGDSSINVISNVQTAGSPVATTFNNQNVDTQTGTTWPGTLHSYGRGLIFANPSGVYALYGGAAEKISDDLDGIFTNADFTFVPSGGTCYIFNIKVYYILLKSKDYAGTVRKFMCIWDGKKWFIGTQDKTDLVYVDAQEVDSVINAYGTDGVNLFRMFSVNSATTNKIIQTKKFAGLTYTVTKQALRLFSLGTDLSGNGYSFAGTMDYTSDVSGEGTIPVTLATGIIRVNWVNNSVQAVQLRNNSAQNVFWLSSAAGLSLLGDNPSASGCLLGLTISSSSSSFTLAALTMLYRRQAPVGG